MHSATPVVDGARREREHGFGQGAREWIAGQQDSDLVFYADGHVRVYHGNLTPLPRHYVARERLCLRATTDYWINRPQAQSDGSPYPGQG